jgi:4-alpha-glucanotransferase
LSRSGKSPRLFGLWTNLYSVRGERDLGVGDFAALRELIDWSATLGASFIGLNPLHALRSRGADVSPYRPMSRLYRNPLYLDLESIPEFASCAAAKSKLSSSALQDDLHRLQSASHVRYDAVLDLKLGVLDLLFGEFMTQHGTASTPRGVAYRKFLANEGDALQNFATFVALDERFRKENAASDWPTWPAEFREPHSAAVTDFRKANRRRVDFHCFLQFELERQLADLAADARRRGLPIGLYNDLALSTAPDGFEPWAHPDLFVRGASLGAPPDELGPHGQNWSLPPLNPLRLRETGYELWRELLHRSFASAGAIRIDHVMGLLRQFWIPEGMNSKDGAYVAFPADDLFAILALESRRANAIVIGEDLGTIPWGFDRVLERWGVLSTRVLYFERDAKGEFREPAALAPRALTTVSTHDLAPLAGFWHDKDLTLRRQVGQLADDAQLNAAKRRRDFDRQALLRRMRAEKLLPSGGIANAPEVVTAAHAYLARCPSTLVGISFDDLALETEPVNLPGIGQDLHTNWSRRINLPLAELRASPQTARMLAPLKARRFDADTNVQEPP